MLMACGNDRAGSASADATDAAPLTRPLPPLVGNVDPCGRTDAITLDAGRFTYTIPCRPYDRMRDLADPAP